MELTFLALIFVGANKISASAILPVAAKVC